MFLYVFIEKHWMPLKLGKSLALLVKHNAQQLIHKKLTLGIKIMQKSQASIKEVARKAGVSIATVSRCLNTPSQVRAQTMARVEQAIKDIGYAPNALAQNFRRGKSRQIMVAIPSVGTPFFEQVMQGIDREAKSSGYNILIIETQFSSAKLDDYHDMVLSKQADGIILLATVSPFENSATNRRLPMPKVVLGLENVDASMAHYPSVRIDNIAAAKDATNFLIRLGHSLIAFIFGCPNEGSTLTEFREQGFREAMKEASLEVPTNWVIDGKMTITGARNAARTLLQGNERPTAIFCANDEMAYGVMHAIKLAGLRVPEDISVVGFDNIRFSEVVDPPLTTIAQPAEEIGVRIVQRLCQAIDGNDIGEGAEVLPHQLVVRQSTAPPAN